MSTSRIDDLIRWARYHGAHVHDQVEVFDDPEQGLFLRVGSPQQSSHSAWKSNQLPSERKNLQPKSRVVSCPFGLSLSFLNALNKFPELQSHSARFPALFMELLEPHVIGHFFLIQQYLNADWSHWGPYIRSLPQPDESEKLGTPLYFSEADLVWIRGTDLEIARKVREKSWRLDWERGYRILDSSSGWEMWQGKWTWDLYKWAATIFSSRSFISTLIPEEVLKMPITYGTRTFSGIYPVLFPLLDLANHNSDAKVTWFTNVHNEPKDLSILVESEIPYGQQIFNNYAPKSNTELMLGYGFSLPGNDEVSIALRPLSEDNVAIRERQLVFQNSHGTNSKQNIFYVRTDTYTESSNDKRPPLLTFFEDGCVDTLSVLVANQRERDHMIKNPSDSLERMDVSCPSSLSRNFFSVLAALLEKLDTMLDLIESASEKIGIPENSCQRAAKLYRDGQISVLQTVSKSIRLLLDAVLSRHRICGISSEPSFMVPQTNFGVELVTLRCGFSWLQGKHRELYDSTIQIIGNELEVTTVPDVYWMELIASGWDYTVWCLWIYIALLLRMSEKEDVVESYVSRWANNMFDTYDPDKTFIGEAFQGFHGDRDEDETLKLMADQVTPKLIPNMDFVNIVGDRAGLDRRMLNFASMIAMEETFPMGIKLESDKGKERVHQRILYMSEFPTMYGHE